MKPFISMVFVAFVFVFQANSAEARMYDFCRKNWNDVRQALRKAGDRAKPKKLLKVLTSALSSCRSYKKTLKKCKKKKGKKKRACKKAARKSSAYKSCNKQRVELGKSALKKTAKGVGKTVATFLTCVLAGATFVLNGGH